MDRYWIDDNIATWCIDLYSWFGVVDEEAGGIIAYFNSEENAKAWIILQTGGREIV